ncbi:hypothetical protein ACFC0M_26460 [Streptomyces sp. NPDC056149]|uniref:hypothetical protein n=1 Tax=unclassified Streptomyces TaxID=2593676 RepID=UPI00238175CA|nr:hypothetical protein [Streptomyces sp. WZ-12]
MSEAKGIPDVRVPDAPRMTLRVYEVDSRGLVTRERGEVRVMPEEMLDPHVLGLAFPPCRCRRCLRPVTSWP